MRPIILSIRDLVMRFGGITALNNVSFDVFKGSITAIIGPNGAGKTTLFNCLTGFYKPTSGQMTLFSEQDISIQQLLGQTFQLKDFFSLSTFSNKFYYKLFGGSHLVCRAGISRTFQNIRLFNDMTVIENCLVAQHLFLRRNLISGLISSKAYREAEQVGIEQAFFWLRILRLDNQCNELAGSLPYGSQRRLEIARALCTKPEILCLDEPAAGLNPQETDELKETILLLQKEHHKTVLLIEHDMSLVMDISEHILVLDHGERIADGSPSNIQNNPEVLRAYLGSDEEILHGN